MIAATPLRSTRQRRVILEELRKTRSHPTADELYQSVRRRLPRVSLATVYRNLEEMAERGMIRKIATGTGPRRFDADISEHFHVQCVRCGRVMDVETDERCLELTRELRGLCKTDFAVRGVNIEWMGLCPSCEREETMNGGENGEDGVR